MVSALQPLGRGAPALRLAAALLLATAACSGASGGDGAEDAGEPLASADPIRDAVYELTWDAPRAFDDPYDPDQVEVTAVFRTPTGETETVDGFWYQGYRRRLTAGDEQLRADGLPTWKVRYTPRQAGPYAYHLLLVDHVRGDSVREPAEGEVALEVQESTLRGFVRVSGRDPRYLEYDDGSFFLGLGHNLCGWEWPGVEVQGPDTPAGGAPAWVGDDNAGGTYDFDRWLGRLAAAGGTVTQFDLSEGDNLEWTPNPGELPYSADWSGVGRYNQQTAWKLDQRVAVAQRLGVSFRLGLLHWEDFDAETAGFPGWGWARNPYNAARGGPAVDPAAFFTSAEARRVFRRTLRYVNARWGASRSLLAWELWNEADLALDFGASYPEHAADVDAWHAEMADYLRAIDPYRHPVTTSFSWREYGDSLWGSSAMSLSTIHQYSYYLPPTYAQYDTVDAIAGISALRRAVVEKPFFFGEFALSPGGDVQRLHDPTGVELHKQLWASMMTGSAVSAMHWSWGSYVDGRDLYHHYAPLAAFLAGADLRGVTPFDLTSGGLRVLGLQQPTHAYGWAVDPAWTFTSVEAGLSPASLGGEAIPVDFLTPGSYGVRFTDPWTGASLGEGVVGTAEGRRVVVLPPWRRDVAFEILPAAP